MAEPITVLISSWLTPSSLFLLVHLVIATIVITSRFSQTHRNPPQLVRSPSLLQRVRSFRLGNHYHYEPNSESEFTHPQLARASSSLLERVRSFNFGIQPPQSGTEQVALANAGTEQVALANAGTEQVALVNAETEHVQPEPQDPKPENPREPKLGRVPSLLQRVRSMNLTRLYRSETEDPEPAWNVVADLRKSASERADGAAWEDGEVDAKADDFINRFKKQLRLQRIDSLIRYRDMLRGN